MQLHTPARIEALEDRIAPAGLVTAVYDPATLTLTLTGDGMNNEVAVFQTGPGTYRIEGVATDIDTAGTTFKDIGKLARVIIDGGDGNDTFTLTNLRTLKSLSFTGGGGDDSLDADNLTVTGPTEFHGNAGNDDLSFDGVSTLLKGPLTVDSAPGANDSATVIFAAQTTVVSGAITFAGGGGDDSLVSSGIGPATFSKGIDFTSGAGGSELNLNNNGTLTVGKLPTGQSIRVTGGDGEDDLSIFGFGGSLRGGVDFQAGAGQNGVSLTSNGSTLKVGKLATGESLKFTGTTGDDTLNSSEVNLAFAGAVVLDVGAGNNAIDLGGGKAVIGKGAGGVSLSLTGLGGDDSITTNFTDLTLKGGIALNGGDGANFIDVFGTNGRTSIGKLATGESILVAGGTGADTIGTFATNLTLAGGIKLTGGDGNNEINLVSPIGTIKIGKLPTGRSILFTGGTGNNDIISDAANITLSGGIELDGGSGTNNDIEFDDNGVVKIGKFGTGQSVLFTGTGTADNEIDFGGTVTLAGSIIVVGGSGSDDIDLDGKVSVGKDAAGLSISLTGNGGDDDIDLADNITLAGGLKHDGGVGNDDLDLNGPDTLTIKGPVEFIGGADNDFFDVSAIAAVFGRTVTFTGGDGDDDFVLRADGTVAGDVNVDLGDTAVGAQVIIFASQTGLPGGLSLKGKLTALASGTTTADFFTLTNVAVAKAIDLTLGNGASTVTIDNLNAGDTFDLDTRDGADVVEIERNFFFGGSLIRKLATIQLGSGDDVLNIGNPLPAPNPTSTPDSTRVNFIGGLATDGGAQTTNDDRNLFENENDFGVPITPPAGFEVATQV